MNTTLKLVFSAAALTVTTLAMAGKPFDVEYPNIVRPAVQFGTYGSAAGQFNEPSGIAITGSGEILIADCFNRRIQAFDYRGNFVRAIANEAFTCPQGVAAADDGTLYVADSKSKIYALDSEGRILTTIGARGNGTGQLLDPTNIAVKGEKLYVVDQGNSRISIFKTSGTFVRTIGRFGSASGRFSVPRAVTVDEDGYLYVVDNLHRVQKFDQNGRFIKQWGRYGGMPGDLAEPADISYANGMLYVADLVNHRLQVFDTSGRFLLTWGRHPEEMHEGMGRTHYPSYAKASPDGKIVIVCEPFEYRCQIFDTASLRNLPQVNVTAWWQKFPKFHYGAGLKDMPEEQVGQVLSWYKPRPNGFTQVAIGAKTAAPVDRPHDMFYITEPDIHRVVAFDANSAANSLSSRWSTGSFGSGALKWGMLSSIAPVRSRAATFVSDAANNVMQELDMFTGQYKATHFGPGTGPGQFNGIDGLTEAKNGDLYIGDFHNNRVQVFDKNLKFKFMFGGTGDGKGQLYNPKSPTLDPSGEKLYVSDTGNFRVQVFDKSGKYLFEFGRRAKPGEWGNGTFLQPWDIAVSPKGEIYVTDPALQLVQRFSADGKFIGQWGGWGTKPGQFYKCKGIAVGSNGNVFVIDFGNHRGQIFTENGEFLAIFGEGILFPAGMLDEEGKPKNPSSTQAEVPPVAGIDMNR